MLIRGDRLLVPDIERYAFSHSLRSWTREPLLAMSPRSPRLPARQSLTESPLPEFLWPN
jgi:hypothetical protein